MHGGKLSNAHINKYHQGLILLSQFVRQTNRGSFTVETERLEQTRALPEILTTAEVKELYNACDADLPEDLSNKEIAERMNINIGTVETYFSTAFNQLRAFCLKPT